MPRLEFHVKIKPESLKKEVAVFFSNFFFFRKTKRKESVNMFAHLHVHTQFSLLDGANKIKDCVKKVKEMGQNSCAITDHGVMYGVIGFYKECLAQGIKPIIGCEVYVSPGSRFDKQGTYTGENDSKYNHLVLLCENMTGYQNLCKIVSTGFTEGFYFKPRVDREVLEAHHEGLICLSACLAGAVPQALLKGDYEKAKATALEYQRIFGKENFFIEIQDHGIKEQKMTNPDLVRIAEEIGAEVVATNDAHYTNKEDAEAQDVLLCIQTGKTLDDEKRMRFETQEFYMKSEEEMRELFPYAEQAIDNTQKIADRCNVEFTFGVTKLPQYDIPEGYTSHYEYFKYLCDKGLAERYGKDCPKEYKDRLDYELGVIDKMGYVDYFLIVWDFINWAREHGIPVGPGRGSGAGSIAAYAVGITDIDPMRYGLFFERFLNPERVSMPDFDIDFCYERRGEVIDYVVEKYGKERVSQIITYQTMAARGSIRDVGRVLGVPYGEVDKLAKMVPNELKMTIKKALEVAPDFREAYDTNENARKIIDIAMKIEGLPKSCSKHAAGVLICDKSIVEYAPLMTDKEGESVIQCTMLELEDLGLLKFDFLGLRTLTVIKDTEKAVQKKCPGFDIRDIPMDDQKVFGMLSKADTLAVFQLESGGMRSVLTGIKPNSIEDLTALISLYRPGPMDSIPDYIRNKENPDGIVYDDPKLEPILGVTYGCIVYQEQVMRMFQDLAGFSLGRADIVRRAMSKKKEDVMEREKKIFIEGLEEDGKIVIEGARRRGISEEVCNKLMDEMTSFAAYAFNKSHAACYAVIAYQTAYLKYYYPVEFMAAMLTSIIENNDKLSHYCDSITKMGIKILPPNVNNSQVFFTADDNGDIVFGLNGLSGVGRQIMLDMISERKSNGEFTSFYDFLKRMAKYGINKKVIESLISAGAFDWTGFNRRELEVNFPKLKSQADQEAKSQANGQLSLFEFMSAEDQQRFAEPEMHHCEDYSEEERLRREKKVCNLYISGHPLNSYRKAIGSIECVSLNEVAVSMEEKDGKFKSGQYITFPAVLSEVNHRLTKKGTPMCTFSVQDSASGISAIAFESCVKESGFLMQENACVLIKGKLDVRDEEDLQVVCNNVYALPRNDASEEEFKNFHRIAKSRKKQMPRRTQATQQPIVPKQTPHEKYGKGLYLKVPSQKELSMVADQARLIPGTLPVFIYCVADNKIYRNDNLKISLNGEKEPITKIIEICGAGNTKLYTK